MSFPQQVSRVPTSIGIIWHVIKDDPDNPDGIRYIYQVRDQNGDVMKIEQGDEQPHLTQAQIDGLLAFAAAQRGKAEDTLP